MLEASWYRIVPVCRTQKSVPANTHDYTRTAFYLRTVATTMNSTCETSGHITVHMALSLLRNVSRVPRIIRGEGSSWKTTLAVCGLLEVEACDWFI